MKKIFITFFLILNFIYPCFAGVDFDGTDDYIEVPSADSIKMASSLITIAAFVKFDSTKWQTIVDKRFS